MEPTQVLPRRRVGNRWGALALPLGIWMGLPQVLPHWGTDGAPPRRPWGTERGHPDPLAAGDRWSVLAPPLGAWVAPPQTIPTGNQQGTPTPPQVLSPGGRLGWPRAAPRGRDWVAKVLLQGDTRDRAP